MEASVSVSFNILCRILTDILFILQYKMSLFMDKEILLFDNATSASTGKTLTAIDWQHVVLTLATSWSANFTVKIKWSNQEFAPDFSAAASVTNRWEHLQVRDLQTAAAIDGNTWITFAGTDAVRMLEVNINRVKWISATITSYTAGNITLAALWSNNQ